MLRAKRRRTQTHDTSGNPIPNTMNSTPLQSKYVSKNMHQKQLQECKCFCGNSGCNCPLKHSAVEIMEARRCNTKISRNPILGYRKVLHFPEDCPNPNELKSVPTNTVYKDNYAKTCGAFRNEIGTVLKANGENKSNTKLCGYSQTKPHIQNRNGWKNDKYNYSSKQYLERRCRTFKDQEFNFLSNIPLNDSEGSEFLTGCKNITVVKPKDTTCRSTLDLSKILGIDCRSSKCEQLICAKKGYTKCEATKNNCKDVYKRTNNNCKAVYKRSNPRFSTQGAVSGGSRLNRLKYQTQLKAQSTGYVVSGKNNQNKTSMTNNSTSSTSFGIDPFINSVNGFGNAVNGAYPVSLYRSTYPTYKANLGGLCIGKGQTRNGRRQACKMSDVPNVLNKRKIIKLNLVSTI